MKEQLSGGYKELDLRQNEMQSLPGIFYSLSLTKEIEVGLKTTRVKYNHTKSPFLPLT